MSSRRSFGLRGSFLRKGSHGIQTVKPNSGEGTSRQEIGRVAKSGGKSQLPISDSTRDIEGAFSPAGCGSLKNLKEPRKSSTFFESSCFDVSSPCASAMTMYIRLLTIYVLDRIVPPATFAFNSRPGYLPKEISASLINLPFLLLSNRSRALSRLVLAASEVSMEIGYSAYITMYVSVPPGAVKV